MKLLGVILGIYAAFFFLTADWAPLPRKTPNWEIINGRKLDSQFSDIDDLEKREFFMNIYETFEVENPKSEKQDVDVDAEPTLEESSLHYKNFDRALSIIQIDNCPLKQLVVPSRWLNLDKVDRRFKVFDIEKCKRTGKEQ